MKVLDNGSAFTVLYKPEDCASFNRSWPGSEVEGSGFFTFEKASGDLVDGSFGDGDGWGAFSQDCQRYGEAILDGKDSAEAYRLMVDARFGR